MQKPDPQAPWRSQYDALAGNAEGVSMQGDPRTPIALLGPELAYEMGFRAVIHRTGAVTVRVPGPQRTEDKAAVANAHLREPISCIPVKTPIMSPEEIVRLARKTRGDFRLLFAFEPEDARIAIHEVSFHFPILISRKLSERANSLSLFVLDFVDYLRAHAAELVPFDEVIAQKILHQREMELDSGVGSLISTLARVRAMFGMKSHAHCWRLLASEEAKPEIRKSYRDRIITAVRYLAQPELSHIEVLRLGYLKEQIADPTKRIIFENIARDFLASRPTHCPAIQSYRCESAADWAQEYVLGLDARIQEIRAAYA